MWSSLKDLDHRKNSKKKERELTKETEISGQRQVPAGRSLWIYSFNNSKLSLWSAGYKIASTVDLIYVKSYAYIFGHVSREGCLEENSPICQAPLVYGMSDSDVYFILDRLNYLV